MKIMIVDDHEVVRTGLRTLLERKKGHDVVGEAGTAAEALKVASETNPDLILMDVRLPDESGVEACRRIRSKQPKTKVIMLTSFADDEAVFASIMAGASGYLLKQIRTEHLFNAIHRVERGESLLDQAIAEVVMNRVTEVCEGTPNHDISSLTDRERQILCLVGTGMTNQEIADELCLSERTVRNYVSSVLQKLNIPHRTQAAIFYMKKKAENEKELP